MALLLKSQLFRIKKNLNHADHINLRHLRAISFWATESVRTNFFSSENIICNMFLTTTKTPSSSKVLRDEKTNYQLQHQ